MNSSLYIGATGMKGLAQGMQVTTNNLANISTIGFKQQDILFSDVLYQTQASMGDWWNAQDDSRVAIGQVGMGLQVEAVRTRYTQGDLQSTNSLTDLAIDGKGFFQVTDGTSTFYTRAGDFVTDAEGVWRTPSGLALNGFLLDANGEKTELAPIRIDSSEPMAPKATASVDLTLNLAPRAEGSVNAENPYFALFGNYNAASATPLPAGSYSTSQAMTFYDAEGNPTTVTAYFDEAPSGGGSRFVEFVFAGEPATDIDENGAILPNQAGDGLLMSGVLQFDESGHLVNVAAFTPTEAGNKDLATWTPASLVNGAPALLLDGEPVAINFGIAGQGDWANAPATAAEIGANFAALPSLGEELITSSYPTTGFNTTVMTNSYKQDGYREGIMSNLAVTDGGRITAYYSNGQSLDLYEIPVCRFTSEDGLRREGGNLFSATEESGQMEMGTSGTENYGDIRAYNIEGSNVDMAQEMVSMILTQRGFQSNSKVVTTADEMLRKAMELKR